MEKSCCFIGHRKIVWSEELEQRLSDYVENLIVNEGVVNFLFGSQSEFNNLCYKVVTKLREKYSHIRRLFYTCRSEACVLEKDRERYQNVFYLCSKQKVNFFGFEAEVEHKNKYCAGRASYIERNYAMIDDSDYCVFYFDRNCENENKIYKHSSSGTKISYLYAMKKKKNIEDLLLTKIIDKN